MSKFMPKILLPLSSSSKVLHKSVIPIELFLIVSMTLGQLEKMAFNLL